MATENSAEKFLELENSASRLLKELEELRQESKNYEQASTNLEAAGQDVRELAKSLESAAEQLQSLVAGLRDIGMPELLDKIAGLESRFTEATREIKEVQDASSQSLAGLQEEIGKVDERSTVRLDALIEYHSKGVLGKIFGKPRRSGTGQS